MSVTPSRVMSEGAPLLGTGSGREPYPLASRATRCVVLGLAALFAVSACTAVVTIERAQSSGLSQISVKEVYARSETSVRHNPVFCGTCAVVIPSDTYGGGSLGGAIDSADCVVRFNGHGPGNCTTDSSSNEKSNAKSCPSPEDYGTKDDIRVMNGNPEVVQALVDAGAQLQNPGSSAQPGNFVRTRAHSPAVQHALTDSAPGRLRRWSAATAPRLLARPPICCGAAAQRR